MMSTSTLAALHLDGEVRTYELKIMDTLIFILPFVTTICWMRHDLGSTDISNAAKKFDLKYQVLLHKIAGRKAIPTLDETASFFGWLSGLYFGIYLLSLLLKLNDTLWLECVSFAYLISFGLFFSIKWFTQPKQFALQFFLDCTKLCLTFFLLPILDWLAGTNITWACYELFIKSFLWVVQLPVPLVSHPILMALILFGFFEVILIIFWVISTIFFASITFFSLVVVVILIRMSRYIYKKFDKDPLQGTCLVPLVVALILMVVKNLYS